MFHYLERVSHLEDYVWNSTRRLVLIVRYVGGKGGKEGGKEGGKRRQRRLLIGGGGGKSSNSIGQ